MQDFEPIKQTYRDLADKYKLHIAVAKLGYTPQVGTFDTPGYQKAQFHYRVSLTIGTDSLTNKPKGDGTGYETARMPGTGTPLVIDWHCGEAVPMSDPLVIARVNRQGSNRVPSYIRNPRYQSYGRMSLDQERVNLAFIRAATDVYEPDIVDILSCLKSDLSCVYYEGVGFAVSFEEFCQEMGMNSDSIKDKQCYEAVMEQSMGVLKLLGIAGVAELLALEGL